MNLKDYLSTPTVNRSEFARAVGVSPAVAYQWETNRRPVPVERCFAVERATKGVVTRRDLRPDDWHLIWPELATAGEAEHA